MKKIINNKLYNTETATELATYESQSSYGSRDSNYYYETLYRTKKGNFFLYGEGNAMSKYSKTLGTNSWCGGSAITVLTETEAKKWLEKYNKADVYESLFSVEEA